MDKLQTNNTVSIFVIHIYVKTITIYLTHLKCEKKMMLLFYWTNSISQMFSSSLYFCSNIPYTVPYKISTAGSNAAVHFLKHFKSNVIFAFSSSMNSN